MAEEPQLNNHDEGLAEALTVRWTRAQPIVASYIASVIRDFNDVEDVLQEVATAVARGFASSDRSRPFVPWALGIARHKVADYQRRHYRNKLVFDSDVLERIEQAHRDIESEASDLRRALDDCVARLQEQGRAMIRMRYVENLKPAQIAERVGMSPNAVSVALHRLRKSLGECIGRRTRRGGVIHG